MTITPSPGIAPAAFTGTAALRSNGAGATQSTGAAAPGSMGASAPMLDDDAFLQLLVAQLRYQDPTAPMDSSAMVAQSAQLSVVDQLTRINEQLTDQAASYRLTLGSSMIGQEITFLAADGTEQRAVAESLRVEGTTTVVRAGDWDVPLTAVVAVTPAS